MPKFSKDILDSFDNREYRHKFVQSLIAKTISSQIKTLRHDKNWTQRDLAKASGKPQSVIARIESAGYGKLTLRTIYDIAEALDVAVITKYVSFRDFIRANKDLSWEALSCVSYDNDDLAYSRLYGVEQSNDSYAKEKSDVSGSHNVVVIVISNPLSSPRPGHFHSTEGALYAEHREAISA